MLATFKRKDTLFTVDLSQPLDLSIALRGNVENPRAWYLGPPTIEPVQDDGWIGKVSEGASVNFNNINFNPHAHGTHTECVGHITEAFHSVNECLQHYFYTAEVITVTPEDHDRDLVISEAQLQSCLQKKKPEAVVIRTLPNTSAKQTRNYSHTNWPYLQEDAALLLRKQGVKHLLIDLPSVDKEKDEGKLLAHKAFWNYPKRPRLDATITEFIYVDHTIKDGSYLLNLQVAAFHNDAAPSRPVLYRFLE